MPAAAAASPSIPSLYVQRHLPSFSRPASQPASQSVGSVIVIVNFIAQKRRRGKEAGAAARIHAATSSFRYVSLLPMLRRPHSIGLDISQKYNL